MSRFPQVLLLSGLSASLALVLASSGLRAQDGPAIDGAALYKKHCQMCHMADGNNTMVKNASFTDGVWVHGTSIEELTAVIKSGVKGTAMLPFGKKLTDAQIEALARYVRAFDKKLKPADDR